MQNRLAKDQIRSEPEPTGRLVGLSHQSDEVFRACFIQAGIGLAVANLDGSFLEVNDAYCLLTGYARAELLRLDFLSVTHPDDGGQDLHHIEEMIMSSSQSLREVRYLRKDGGIVWVAARISQLHDDHGRAMNLLIIAREISEQKRAEEALKESEERYRDLVENSHDLICTHDLEGVILSANRTAIRVLGYDPRAYCGKKSLREILAPDVREQFDAYLARVRAEGQARGLMLVQTSSGEERIWEYQNTLRTEGVAAPIVRGMARDITERKRAEEALRESESLRRMIIESEPECVKLVGLDCSLLDMNQAGLAMIGAGSLAQVVGQSVLQLVAPEWRDTFLKLHERVCQGESVVAEFEMLDFSGARHWMETHAAPLRNKESTVIAHLALTREITERRQVERSLKLFRTLIDQSSDAIEVMDANTLRFLDCNENAYARLGYSREEFLTLSVLDIDPLADPAMLGRLEAEMEKSGVATVESLHRRKDGSTFPVEINVKVVRLDRDYRLAVVRDISDRKRAEVARTQLAAIVESSEDAIASTTLDGTIISWNLAAERIYGYSAEEVTGHPITILVPRDRIDEVSQMVEILRTGKSVSHFETMRLRKDGQVIDVSLTISPLRDEAGDIIGASTIVRDITQHKQDREQLRYFSRRLMEAHETERQSIARELHDEIGQVLTGVKINLQALQRSPETPGARRLEESIVVVDEALDRVRELSFELRPSLLDDLGLPAALRWYVNRYAERTGIEADVVWDGETDSRLPRELETACFRIAQEALTNVARHSQATEVFVRLKRTYADLQLAIRDNGQGFAVDELMISASSASVLGLRGMAERALAVEGQVEIDSTPGQGTEVRATFPLRVGR